MCNFVFISSVFMVIFRSVQTPARREKRSNEIILLQEVIVADDVSMTTLMIKIYIH